MAGYKAPTPIHSSYNSTAKPQSFILCPLPCSTQSGKSLHNASSGFFSTPVDGAHVDNIHRMSIKTIHQQHLMKAQLQTAQLYNRVSSVRTPATCASLSKSTFIKLIKLTSKMLQHLIVALGIRSVTHLANHECKNI